jgi:hypothetical protein
MRLQSEKMVYGMRSRAFHMGLNYCFGSSSERFGSQDSGLNTVFIEVKCWIRPSTLWRTMKEIVEKKRPVCRY